MHTDDAFNIFQRKIDAAAIHVYKARYRRDIFCDALKTLYDVTEALPSGSLARETQLDPIHDVDLIAVFDKTAHPGWGEEDGSADQALNHAQEQVRALLGEWGSLTRHVVGEIRPRNHVVQCFLEPRFLAEDTDFSGWFAVEVMPALRDPEDGVLLIPERRNNRWQKADPEWLIAEVKRRQQRWEYLVRTVRMIKAWSIHVKTGMKSLAAEVLVLQCLPDLPVSELSRSVALLRFFTAAASAVMWPIEDPAAYCGPIQPGLDRVSVRALLLEAADIAADAVAWEHQGEHHRAICCWRMIFGPKFPVPPGGCPGLPDDDEDGQGVPDPEPDDGTWGSPDDGEGPFFGGDGPSGSGPSGGGPVGGGSGGRPSGGGGGPGGGDSSGGQPFTGGSGVVGGGFGDGREKPNRGGASPTRPVTDAPQGYDE